MTNKQMRHLLLLGCAMALAACGGPDAPDGAASAARPDSASVQPGALPPGVTVDTQTIEDSTVAEMYVTEDSAGGR